MYQVLVMFYVLSLSVCQKLFCQIWKNKKDVQVMMIFSLNPMNSIQYVFCVETQIYLNHLQTIPASSSCSFKIYYFPLSEWCTADSWPVDGVDLDFSRAPPRLGQQGGYSSAKLVLVSGLLVWSSGFQSPSLLLIISFTVWFIVCPGFRLNPRPWYTNRNDAMSFIKPTFKF